jgi:dihydroorotate dehydrogenase (fumarate)
LNSYGSSPHPLSAYLGWIRDIISTHPDSHKPFLISITSSVPEELSQMLADVQRLRADIQDRTGQRPTRIAVELNTSCPNIKHAPPPSYNMPSLIPLLAVFAEAFFLDETLTLGLKLPPYLYAQQFEEALAAVASLTREERNPIAFLTCTNTLGNSLLFADQVDDAPARPAGNDAFALPTPLGGLAGEPLHALALGNVLSFSRLLAAHPSACIRRIAIVGVGGVIDAAGAERMRSAGAHVVGCATLLGRKGVEGFSALH